VTLKIKVGSMALAAARDVALPQEFAAWHQTVRVEPATYDVFAYLDRTDGSLHLRRLSAQCEGTTVSSNFSEHAGQRATAHVDLPTAGLVADPAPLLAQSSLCDALVRVEWDPRERDPRTMLGWMWRFTWNPERRPVVIQEAVNGKNLHLAAFEDHRRFRVDADDLSPDEVKKLDLHFQFLTSVDQFAVGQRFLGWSPRTKRAHEVTRLS